MSKLKELERLFTEGKISRRDFMAYVSAMGLTALVSPALLATQSEASTPKRGGRLRIGFQEGDTSATLDNSKSVDAYADFLSMGQLRNALTTVNHKSEAIPELAESWEVTPDAKQWVFKLRKGVEFHNGKSFDADDVIYSINLHRGEDSKSSAKSLFSSVADIKKDGKYTVIFSLNSGVADFPYYVATYKPMIVPAESDPADGVGTGPFILKDFEPGVRTLCTRNPNYFIEGRPYFDEVESFVIADTTARTSALQTGQIDVMSSCDLKTVHLLEKTPGIEILRATSTLHYCYEVHCDTPPFDNNDVRLALKYAIDREHQLKMILRGYGAVGNDNCVAPFGPLTASESELPQRQYDPDKAKYHLKKAGLQNPTFSLHVAESAFANAVDSAVLYKESAEKAGINIDVVRHPNDGFWKNVWMKDDKPFCALWWMGRTVPDIMMSIAWAAEAPWNSSRWKNPRFNELLVTARAELDLKKRREMYVEMQNLASNEGGTIVFAFADHVAAGTDKIGHGPLSGYFWLDGTKCAERWWFKS